MSCLLHINVILHCRIMLLLTELIYVNEIMFNYEKYTVTECMLYTLHYTTQLQDVIM